MSLANEKLPPELLAQMEKPKNKIRKDAHTLTLVYIEHNGPATVDEILVYIWRLTGDVKSRDYIYHILQRLRDRKVLERIELESETVVRHMLTPTGEAFVKENDLKYFTPEGET